MGFVVDDYFYDELYNREMTIINTDRIVRVNISDTDKYIVTIYYTDKSKKETRFTYKDEALDYFDYLIKLLGGKKLE